MCIVGARDRAVKNNVVKQQPEVQFYGVLHPIRLCRRLQYSIASSQEGKGSTTKANMEMKLIPDTVVVTADEVS